MVLLFSVEPLQLFQSEKGSVRLKKNGNGNGNGNDAIYYQLGNCFMCGAEGIPITKFPIFRQDVFGINNDKVPVCRDCADLFKSCIKAPMNNILKNYRTSYDLTSEAFLRGMEIDDVFLELIWAKSILGHQREIDHIIDFSEPESCPICGHKKLTCHHIRKRAVFGENNFIVYFCRKCHDRLEVLVTTGEVFALRDNYLEFRMEIDSMINNLRGVNAPNILKQNALREGAGSYQFA
jgi:transcription elongation factor Elf1